MKKRRILAWFMAMVMAIGLLPATAFAADDRTFDSTSAVYALDGSSGNDHTDMRYIWQDDTSVYVAFVAHQQQTPGGTATLGTHDGTLAWQGAAGETLTITNSDVKNAAPEGKNGQGQWAVFEFANLSLYDIQADGFAFKAAGGHEVGSVTIPEIAKQEIKLNVEKNLSEVVVDGTRVAVVIEDGNVINKATEEIINLEADDVLVYEVTLKNDGEKLFNAMVVVEDAKITDKNCIEINVEGDTDFAYDVTEAGKLMITGVHLNAGNSITVKYEYTVTAADVEKGEVENVVIVKDNENEDEKGEVIVPIIPPIVLPEDVTLTYDANDGSKRTEVVEYKKGDVVTVATDVFTREDYQFMGWSKTPFGTESVPAHFTITEDTTLYAIWAETVHLM